MMPLRFQRAVRLMSCVAAAAVLSPALGAGPEPLPQDRGAAGAWQKLLKLQTTASAMHTTAHPDDEHGGLLAQLSRGRGARESSAARRSGRGRRRICAAAFPDRHGNRLRLSAKPAPLDHMLGGTPRSARDTAHRPRACPELNAPVAISVKASPKALPQQLTACRIQ
jgi:hypothetical protein